MRDDLNDRSTLLEADEPTIAASTTAAPGALAAPVALPEVEEEVLIEEVSIDGMCGVY